MNGQVLLTCCGLGPWGLSEARDMHSLLDMNKEGLVSVLGYWALHLWGAAFAAVSSASLQVECFACGWHLRVKGHKF